MINTPDIEGKDQADVFLIRHGFSEFNNRHLILKKDEGGEDNEHTWNQLKGDPSLIDANLHNIGVH